MVFGLNDQSQIAVVLDDAFHESAGGKIGLRGQTRDLQRRQSAPKVKWIRQLFEPNLLGQKDLAGEWRLRSKPGVAPADQLVILDDVLELGRIGN